ncbi:Variant-specific surface protein, partial [Giardia duodenalis]
GKCTQCAQKSFMYKGGCYKDSQAPGNTMCETATDGVCTRAKDGYFVPPGADASHQSVIPCGDEEVVTLGNSKQYKGIPNCLTCTAPANGDGAETAPKTPTCDTCKEGFFGPSEASPCQQCTDENCATCGAAGEAKCSKCKAADASGAKLYLKKGEGGTGTCVTEAACVQVDGYYIEGEECKKCSAPCVACTGQATHCTKCDPAGETPYLKDNNCVNEASCISGNTHYADAATKECKLCADGGLRDCTTCEVSGGTLACKACPSGDKNKFGLGKKSCVQNCPANSAADSGNICACNEGFEPNNDWSACRPKSNCRTPNCQACDNEGRENEVCTACLEGKYLTPTNQCVSDCTAIKGYYGNDTDRKCKKCNDACVECKGADANQCTACPAGKMLKYTEDVPDNGGTCVDQCSVSSTSEGCEICGAKIGGTDYCSKCKGADQVSINGVCSRNSQREAACSSLQEGICKTCGAGYFLFNGGCYKTDQQPGKQVCAQANGGKCQTCASGLAADNGDCSKSTCHSTCATCTEANQPDKCSACPPGRYLDATNVCKLCTETSSSIQGVANCASCAPPSNNQGPVLCYLMNGDSAGGSTNKSGLSTGAIAGISVAVIVVVGGLVGFLCWWFICRGKA